MILERINRFEDKESLRFISKIFLEMLSGIVPNYPQKIVFQLLKNDIVLDVKMKQMKFLTSMT